MDTKYVYEVRDISNDEIYYPLGIFLNLDDAKKQILEFEKDQSIADRDDDYEVISIYRRSIDWSRDGTEVFSVRRERDYQEETGNYYWELVEQNEF